MNACGMRWLPCLEHCTHERYPAPDAGDTAASDSTDNVQSTLQRVNEAARAAAEGSTGQVPGSSPAGPDDGQAELQQMLDAMSNAMSGDGEEANSFVETLMHGLLSKEVLFDPLKVCTPAPSGLPLSVMGVLSVLYVCIEVKLYDCSTSSCQRLHASTENRANWEHCLRTWHDKSMPPAAHKTTLVS